MGDDNDWRKNKKPKEQPKIALNSHISSSNNANPWSSSGQDLGRSAFGSKSQSNSMDSSPNRYGDSSSYNPRAQSQGFGASKFGCERKSKFGGGSSSANATPSKPSKFNKGGGFGAALLKKIDNGTTRVTYAKNNRFSAIMDDDSPKTNSASLQLPAKVQSNRFATINEVQSPALPDIKKERNEQKPLGRAKTTSELQKEWNAQIKADKAAKERKKKEEKAEKEAKEAIQI